MGLEVEKYFTERGLTLAATRRSSFMARQLRDGGAYYAAQEYSRGIAPPKYKTKWSPRASSREMSTPMTLFGRASSMQCKKTLRFSTYGQ
jgi:hypothetical protein